MGFFSKLIVGFTFDILCTTDIFKCIDDTRSSWPGYDQVISRCLYDIVSCCVRLRIGGNINFKIREDISGFASLIFEIRTQVIVIWYSRTSSYTTEPPWSRTETSDDHDNVFSYGFSPISTKPTRITTTSATLIDHIYTNALSKHDNFRNYNQECCRLFWKLLYEEYKKKIQQIKYDYSANISTNLKKV